MRVLIAEDDLASRLLLGAMVSRLGHDVALTSDGEEALAVYRETGADVLLTDWVMPGIDGPGLCRRIREHPMGPYTYIVVVTALTEQEHAMRAVQAGADDHLAKPVHPTDLEVRLVVASRVTALHAALSRQELELRRLHDASQAAARTDALTGLGNRLRMAEDLAVESARAGRYGHGYWIALGDLDRFKDFNDRYGHPAGDRLLARVGLALSGSARRSDGLYRYGGEEFLAVLPEESERGAVGAAERLRAAVEHLGVPHEGNAPDRVATMTVGVAPLGGDVERALRRADEALYSAKAAGRNRLGIAGDHPAPRVVAPAVGDRHCRH